MDTYLLSKANSDEVNGIGLTVVTVAENSPYKEVPFTNLTANLKNDIGDLTVALNQKRYNEKTAIICDFEDKRDSALKSFFKTINAATFRLNKDIAEQAMKIQEVIKRHGSRMYDLPDIEQTSKMTSLFSDLSTAEMVAAIETTNTTDILQESKDANTNYLQSLGDRSHNDALKIEVALVTKSKKKVRNSMKDLINYLNSIVKAIESEDLKTLHIEIQDIISTANAKIRARESRKNNDSEENNK